MKLASNRTLIDKKLNVDVEETLVPMEILRDEDIRIREATRTAKKSMNTRSLEDIYLESPVMLRDQDSNLEPSPYTFPNISKRRGLYHCRDPPEWILGISYLVSTVPLPVGGFPRYSHILTDLAFTVIPRFLSSYRFRYELPCLR